jgi:arginine decarboxylase
VVEDITPIEIDEDDPQVVIELGELKKAITIKNYREYYHDALEHREELFTLFNLGLISLEDRAKGEVLFWDVCEHADRYAQHSKYVPEEFGELRRLLCAKYLTNFSVFRSVPDHWRWTSCSPLFRFRV